MFFLVTDYPECRTTGIGSEYLGSQTETASGRPCVAWDSPGSSNRQLGSITSCRNPDLRHSGPWCYVDPNSGESEDCNIPFCKRTFLIMGYGKNNEANNQLKIPLPPGGGGVTNRYK